ncbi:hypothetical protein CAOG_009700 [Capsaspora owczarzaki ATCC 30864]|uniref:ADF-H domain-containing protein n=2 Tax=Capsaspora owczarzaki (strain ATCC 30864) TaxID=595528 RepID=A0A0D2UCK6_CAPO3|nr:hypothetical protein CAOG_009700 [Capsaspora owczarzaki ATCC 30864]
MLKATRTSSSSKQPARAVSMSCSSASTMLSSNTHCSRTSEEVDLSHTVKFVYVHWNGNDVPFAKKGRFGVVHGAVQERFHPYHIDFDISAHNEISEQLIQEKLADASGTGKKVLDPLEAATRQARTFTASPSSQEALLNSKTGAKAPPMVGVNKDAVAVQADDSAAEAIADVRNDATETTWTILSYQDNDVKKPIIAVASGSGDRDQLRQHITTEMVAYILWRTTDVYEGITNVKFVSITWVGDQVKPMAKAKVSTHKGAITPIIGPVHLALNATSYSEITQTIKFNY